MELRELVRGLHPPILEQGLEVALASLVAHSTVPVQLQVELPARPSPAIESMAYFCAAELITNAVRHSSASRIRLGLTQYDDLPAGGPDAGLRLVVEDDGVGGVRLPDPGSDAGPSPDIVDRTVAGTGAGTGVGTGLAGLCRRVGTVDGHLWVDSPPGGPTVVRVVLPLHA